VIDQPGPQIQLQIVKLQRVHVKYQFGYNDYRYLSEDGDSQDRCDYPEEWTTKNLSSAGSRRFLRGLLIALWRCRTFLLQQILASDLFLFH